MFDWLTSYVPWPLLVLLSFVGISAPVAALIFFAPAAVPVLFKIWNATPLWLKAVFVGIGGGFIAFAAGKQLERKKIEEAQRQRDAVARTRATEISNEVDKLTPSEVDKALRDSGGMWDDEPQGGTRKRS